jgi:hypothetical protein
MEVLRETTKWSTGYHVPLHTYILDGTKMLGYIPEGTEKPQMFTSPQTFSRKGRTFAKVGGARFLQALVVKPNRREVQGSKGNVYYVDDEAGTCTCNGYTYRGYCKHLAK